MKTKVGSHPDRMAIEMLLKHWSGAKVELWLLHRYPPRNDLTGEPYPEHGELRIARHALTDYRRKYLEPVWTKDENGGWTEPLEGSPLDGVLPPRPPNEGELMELAAMALAIEAAEFTLARCLIIDGRSGIVADITVTTLKALAEIAEKRAMLAARLGIPGYELVPEKLQVDSRSMVLHGNVEHTPLEPEKVALAKALLEIEPAKRAILMSAPLTQHDPSSLLDDIILRNPDLDTEVVEG